MYKFTSFSIADSFRNRCEIMMLIVLGDDNKFWVVTPALGEQLVDQGFQYVI